MFVRLLMPAILLSLCVVVHAMAMTAILRRLSNISGPTVLRFWRSMWILIRVALAIFSAHLLEIAFWAAAFTWQQLFPDFRTSFYFSAVTYTTVGYGDLVLPEQWRLLAVAEALTGILMCGWSTGVFFAIVSRVYAAQPVGTTGGEDVNRG